MSGARAFLFLLLRLTGIPFLLREIVQRRRVTILCYHDPEPGVAAAHFRFLSRSYSVIPLRRFLDWHQGKDREPMPAKALVVTFDDGHRNNYRLKDLLDRLGLPVTIFLCSGIVGTRRHYWWKANVNRDVVRRLKSLPDDERIAQLSAQGFDENREYAERQALSHDEIVAMRGRVDFQSHTRLHPILPQCSRERAIEEIASAKRELGARFGLGIYAIAYPNGDYCPRDIEIVKDAGYECALTLDAGFNTRKTNPFRLKRIAMYDDADRNEVVVKASGLWGLLNQVFPRQHLGATDRSVSAAAER